MTVYVYRIYDRDNDLLYVGATGDITQRLRQHHQRWGKRITRVQLTPCDDWDEARILERDTILNEHPAANSDHTGTKRRTGWGELEGRVLSTLQQLGPLTSRECEKAVIARGFEGSTNSVSACILRLVGKGSVKKVGERPALSGRHKTAAVYDAALRARKPTRRLSGGGG